MDGVTEFRFSDYNERRRNNSLGGNLPLAVAFLDLNKVELQGWEIPGMLLLDSYVTALEAGNRFPLIDVVQRKEYYEIMFGFPRPPESTQGYGGHHRAVAHFIANVPLRVRVFEKHRELMLYPWKDIREFDISDDQRWRYEFTGLGVEAKGIILKPLDKLLI